MTNHIIINILNSGNTHHGDTKCQIKNRIRGAQQQAILEFHGKFQPSRYYGLGCGRHSKNVKLLLVSQSMQSEALPVRLFGFG